MAGRNAHLLVGVFLLFLAACATPPQTRALRETTATHAALPLRVTLDAVPYFAQEDYQCGPAALAMSLSAMGIPREPDALAAQTYLPDRQGSLQVEMLAAARRNGSIAYQLQPKLESVLTEVAHGTPVIVLQNLALSWFPVWHYAVVIGYDREREEIILRSGRERLQQIPMATFEHTWARSGYWAMVTLPPGKVATSAEEVAFISSINAFERVGKAELAERSYVAALQRWPKSLSAHIGLGNIAYKMQRLPEAEAAFRQATQDHPESVAAWNNLAQTVADQQRYAEALPLAQRAVELGGPLSGIARSTLESIQKKLNQ